MKSPTTEGAIPKPRNQKSSLLLLLWVFNTRGNFAGMFDWAEKEQRRNLNRSRKFYLHNTWSHSLYLLILFLSATDDLNNHWECWTPLEISLNGEGLKLMREKLKVFTGEFFQKMFTFTWSNTSHWQLVKHEGRQTIKRCWTSQLNPNSRLSFTS